MAAICTTVPFPTRPALLHFGSDGQAQRIVAEEVAVALAYQGTSHAVMMASPDALEDFAIGFSLTEGIIRHRSEIDDLAVIVQPHGIVLRMTLVAARQAALQQRRRRLAGPVGCGLCGLESLDEALRAVPRLSSAAMLPAAEIPRALLALSGGQSLHRLTRSMHAAGFWQPGRGLLEMREDVGRHNALDKLGGALARRDLDPATGAILLTSRVSVELVQKAAMLGAPLLIAASAPTALAIGTAEACGLTLVGTARGEAFEVFTHPERILGLADRAPAPFHPPRIAAAGLPLGQGCR